MVNWNLEIAKYNDPAADGSAWLDSMGGFWHHPNNFRGGLAAIYDDSTVPVGCLGDANYFVYALNSKGFQARHQAAMAKAYRLEAGYGLKSGSLTMPLLIGNDNLSRMISNPAHLVDLCGASIAVQVTCGAGNSWARSVLLAYRSDMEQYFTTLQTVESTPEPAATPTPTPTPTPAKTVTPVVTPVVTPTEPTRTATPSIPSGDPLTLARQAVSAVGDVVEMALDEGLTKSQFSNLVINTLSLSQNDARNLATFADSFHTICQVLKTAYSYQGIYRYAPKVQIPASVVNYEVVVGFPIRVFRLDTDAPINIKLGTTQSDVINLDHQTAPLKMKNIPIGLAFDKFYVTNPNNAVISISLFAMG